MVPLPLLVSLLPLVQDPEAVASRPPNIVLIVADDLGYGELGCYGQTKIETPRIDGLARKGMRFLQHYAGAPVCAPSRCVLLTGKASGHATIRDNQEHEPEGQAPIAAGDTTLAELLQKAGYATGCFGKWGLGYPGSTGDPLRRGFDTFFGFNCQRHAHSYYPESLWRNGERVPLAGNDGAGGPHYAQDLVDEAALAFLRARRDGPFFCFLPVTLPHLALQLPEADLARYRGRWDETPYTGKSYRPHPTPRACYAGMITRLDRTVGLVLDALRELDLEDDTLVLFTSDNGPTHLREQADIEFFASTGGLRGSKGSVYEGGLRVPLIVRWPGRVAAGTTSDHVCGFVDLLPTLCAAAGVPVPADADGIDFVAALRGQPQRAHDHLAWDFPGYGGQLAVRKGRWKAVRRNLRKDPDAPVELFDLAEDPGERVDLAARRPELARELVALMVASRTTPAHPAFRFGAYSDGR